MAARMLALAGALLPLAQGLSMRSEDGGEAPPPPKSALVATVFEHTRKAPVDLILGHQLRMLSGSRKNVAQAAVINAKVEGVDNVHGTVHDPVLAGMTRSFGTTGSVEVVGLEADQAKLQQLLQNVFSVDTGSTANFAKKFFKQDLTDPVKKRAMARFTGMLQFLGLCKAAEFGVDLCINMDQEAFVYRKDKFGIVEMASQLFDEEEELTALQPPTYCDYSHARHRPSWAKVEHWTENKFQKCVANETKVRPEDGPTNMVFSRSRLMSVLPLTVKAEELDLSKGFAYSFFAGLARSRAQIKGMQCGHSFVIHASSSDSMCKTKQHFDIGRHSNAAARVRSSLGEQRKQQLDTLSGEYSLFDQVMVKGLEVVIDRMENGKLPFAGNSTSSKCEEMCPSRERIIDEGLAW